MVQKRFLIVGALAIVAAAARWLPHSDPFDQPVVYNKPVNEKIPGPYDSYTNVRTPVRIQGNAKEKLVKFGRMLQGKDFRVSEQIDFGGVTPGTHEKGSPHYSDNAIDVNKDEPDEARAIDGVVSLARRYGLRTVWRHLEQIDHAHFDTRGGPDLNEDTKG